MGEDQQEKIPKVFISYSHDNSTHKAWVAELATKLCESGIDVRFDRWDLRRGEDITKFMEQSVTWADRVLMICTDAYTRKADEGKGGVGYEAMIVTGELIRNLGTSKFIPIIRQDGGKTDVPKFMGTRLYLNLSEGQKVDEEFDELLRELHDEPVLKKPPIGKNPFNKTATTVLESNHQKTQQTETRLVDCDEQAELLTSMGLKSDASIIIERFHDSPANWFHRERLTAAFPGVRGLQEISNPVEAVTRLSILLQNPLRWVWRTEDGNSAGASPVWWWRGLGNMPIDHFSVVSPTEILMDYQELPIRRVVVANDRAYWQSFVYVESEPKPPIGIYETNPESDARMLDQFGYLHEEYGVYKGRAISRAEYDDGAAILDGKPERTRGAELRVRFLTPYNFIIASQESPINNNNFDLRAYQILNDILKGKSSVQELANEVSKLPKRGHFDGYSL